MAFRRNHGARIDHILVSEPLAEQCKSCVIDKAHVNMSGRRPYAGAGGVVTGFNRDRKNCDFVEAALAEIILAA